jgi:hypothetical protein
MRPGVTIAPASLVVVLALFGAGPDAPSDQAAVLDDRLGIRTAPILLLARPDVQLELGLDPTQISGARSTTARLLEKALSSRNQSGPAVEAERRRINQEMTHWLGQNLNAEQLDRLFQIDLQWEGVSAMLSRPLVTEYLKLTVQQRLAVSRILAAQRETRQVRGALTPREHEQFLRQALAVLSPGQKDLWDRLLGPPCRFTIGGQVRAPRHPAGQQGLESQSGLGR